MKIHYGCITQSEIEDLVPNIETVLPYVDSVTVCDGGSNPNAFMYMRNWAQEEPKLRFFLHPWENNFPKARNNYLKHISELAIPGDYILATDPDEFIEQASLEKMRDYIRIAEQHNRNMIGFQCRSVSLKGKKRVHESMDNFWKRFLIKWDPAIFYGAVGSQVHEFLGGVEHRIWDPGQGPSKQEALIYEHRKQQDITWLRGARNYFIGGAGPNGRHNHIHVWHSLRAITDTLGIKDWHDYFKYLQQGQLDSKLSEHIMAHRAVKGFDGASEIREMYKLTYRILHPELEPEEYKGVSYED